MKTRKLAVLNSHPIQYFAPLYRRIAQEEDIDLTVYYCSRQGLESYQDEGFGTTVQWDIPLLDGYNHTFLPNATGNEQVGEFFSLFNPSIVRELRKGDYDALLVHGHNYATHLLAIAAAKLTSTAVFMRGETHLELDRSPIKRALRQPVMRLLYRICDACLSIGTRNAEFYRQHGVEDDKMFQVPYTVDNAFFESAAAPYREDGREARAEFDFPPDKPLILFASKQTSRKRPADLLKAYEALRNRSVDAALVFVGSGPEEEELRHYAEEREIPDVHFLGFRNQSELPTLYALSDVFVLPSENEPWGLIINEVMCAGMPVVATREIGAVPDLVHHGENGLLYSVGRIDELSDHLETLVTDADLRRDMGERSLEIIDGWNHDRCVEGLRAALSETT
jgi:glycosyltransferase involved in cell wall biosynthesis